MPNVHPTAIVQGNVDLADDAQIGPYCVLTGPITAGPGTRLLGNVYLQGPMTLGANNTIYPFACLGFAPQHAQFDPQTPGQGLVIGDENTFREHVTIHRAFTEAGPTRIGDRNVFMASSHAGHDCQIGNDCTFANGALLGGHVTVEDRVVVGGGMLVHQFCRIGLGAMLSGGMGTKADVPPFFMLTGTNICGAVNMIGLRRSGMPRDQIEDVRWVYKTLYRRGHSPRDALIELKKRSERPMIADYIAFIESSERGYCPAHGKAAIGTA